MLPAVSLAPLAVQCATALVSLLAAVLSLRTARTNARSTAPAPSVCVTVVVVVPVAVVLVVTAD
ncbi:hypothetical protein ACEZCY_35725 [Streptacidiphilus sp. N1-12]|uniref:Uncharacterized protein n=1 Tax=Streptacidiphilus alkalitolerans TaxID=3342712 RepID=A0ABV6WR61_9ACTN